MDDSPSKSDLAVAVTTNESVRTIERTVRRQVRYAEVAAAPAEPGGSVVNLLVDPPDAMFTQFVLKRRFLDGPYRPIATAVEYNCTMPNLALVAARRVTSMHTTN